MLHDNKRAKGDQGMWAALAPGMGDYDKRGVRIAAVATQGLVGQQMWMSTLMVLEELTRELNDFCSTMCGG